MISPEGGHGTPPSGSDDRPTLGSSNGVTLLSPSPSMSPLPRLNSRGVSRRSIIKDEQAKNYLAALDEHYHRQEEQFEDWMKLRKGEAQTVLDRVRKQGGPIPVAQWAMLLSLGTV